MNYMRIDKEDYNNGDGIRVVLWVAGCEHKCKGCHNPETWDCEAGQKFTKETVNELRELLSKDYIDGLTVTGGDPAHPRNRPTIIPLLYTLRKEFPNKNFWCWTGYNVDDLRLNFLNQFDVIVDGKFEEDKHIPGLAYRGSTNQNVWKVIYRGRMERPWLVKKEV